MRKRGVLLLFGLLLLSGCAHQYVMRLNNGTQITTASKPKLERGFWHFKDAKGGDHMIPEGRVREIAPESIAREEDKQNQFKPVKQKQKHWYWPF
jgi:hypothetical protein